MATSVKTVRVVDFSGMVIVGYRTDITEIEWDYGDGTTISVTQGDTMVIYSTSRSDSTQSDADVGESGTPVDVKVGKPATRKPDRQGYHYLVIGIPVGNPAELEFVNCNEVKISPR